MKITHETIWTNVVGAMFFTVVCWWLFVVVPNYEKKVMEIEYCFQENMDGTLYHYECEKNEN